MIEVDLTPEEMAAWYAKRGMDPNGKPLAPVAAPAPVVEEAPAASPCLPMPAVSVGSLRAYRPLVGERKTAHGAVMSDRMHRFYRWMDDNRIGLSDWSTDTMVQAVLPKLQACLAAEEAHLFTLEMGTEEARIQGELVEGLRNIMNRVPENRSDAVSVEQQAKKSLREQLVVVEKEEAGITGEIVYWQLTGTTDRAKLAEAFVTNGVDEENLPSIASPELALGRAMRELQSRSTLVRKLKAAGGWAVVRETEVAGKLDYQQVVRVYLDGKKEEEVLKFEATDGLNDEAQVEFDRVVAEYNKQRASLTVVDISGWLVKLASKMDGVPLRDRGGIYFVPAANVENFHKVKAALAEVSGNVVYEIPAMHSTETVKSIVDAVARDAQSFIDDVESELNGEIGVRAAKNRKDEVAEMVKKVERYEKLLNQDFKSTVDSLKKLGERLGKVTSRAAQLEID